MLHYSGHAQENLLAFEDEVGGVHPIFVCDLLNLLRAGAESLSRCELVVILACKSSMLGKAFASAGVRHVVAVDAYQDLRDVSARVFTRHFYEALALGNTVLHSFEIAKQVRASTGSKMFFEDIMMMICVVAFLLACEHT